MRSTSLPFLSRPVPFPACSEGHTASTSCKSCVHLAVKLGFFASGLKGLPTDGDLAFLPPAPLLGCVRPEVFSKSSNFPSVHMNESGTNSLPARNWALCSRHGKGVHLMLKEGLIQVTGEGSCPHFLKGVIRRPGDPARQVPHWQKG